MNLLVSIIYVQIIIMRYLYLGTEDVVAHCLHQGEEAEARCDGDDQGAGSLQGLCLLWLNNKECLQEGMTSLNLVSWKRERS